MLKQRRRKAPDMTPISISVTIPIRDAMEAEAQRERRSLASLSRILIEEALERRRAMTTVGSEA